MLLQRHNFCQPASPLIRSAVNSRKTACRASNLQLQSIPLTPESFEPFGQVIQPTDDGKAFDMTDAQLELSKGTPRFYIMDLPRRGLSFSRITYHADVTQCLGGLNPPQHWYIVVAAPTGSVADYPQQQQLTAFKVPHGTAIKFKQGTWHAGPLFDGSDAMSFYNLELSDTNVVDHNTHDYGASNDTTFTVLEC